MPTNVRGRRQTSKATEIAMEIMLLLLLLCHAYRKLYKTCFAAPGQGNATNSMQMECVEGRAREERKERRGAQGALPKAKTIRENKIKQKRNAVAVVVRVCVFNSKCCCLFKEQIQ